MPCIPNYTGTKKESSTNVDVYDHKLKLTLTMCTNTVDKYNIVIEH